MVVGLTWLLPALLRPETWATRDFTLPTRLLSEARIVVDYIVWTLLPTPGALSFYHDNFHISTGLLTPWTTLASIAVILGACRTDASGCADASRWPRWASLCSSAASCSPAPSCRWN